MAACYGLKALRTNLSSTKSVLRNYGQIRDLQLFSSATDAARNSSEGGLQTSEAERIEAIRLKSRMPEPIRRQMIGEMPDIIFDFQITDRYQRKLYAKFGRASGINPGAICWPSEEELNEIIAHEQEFEPTLQEMMLNVERRRQEEIDAIKKREEQVEKNLSKLNKWMSDIQAKKEKKLAEIQAQKAKKERLIEEVRQYFGYRLNPKDPKFQEVLEKMEKEEKKAAKEAKKKEKFAKEMARLSAMAQPAATNSSAKNEMISSMSKTTESQPEVSDKNKV